MKNLETIIKKAICFLSAGAFMFGISVSPLRAEDHYPHYGIDLIDFLDPGKISAKQYEESLKNPSTTARREKQRQSNESAVQKPDTTWEIYGRNVVYRDLSEIDFDSLLTDKIPLPSDLQEWLEVDYNSERVKNPEKLERLIIQECHKKGFNQDKIGKLSIPEAITLAAEILAARLTPFAVDNDPNFFTKDGGFLHLEDYFELGKGDCDKYANLFYEIFTLFKQFNKKLSNISVVSSHYGGNVIPHAWNALLIPTKKELIVTHIDPTFYDSQHHLEAERGYHIPIDDEEFRAQFYGNFDYDTAYDLYQNLLKSSTSNYKRGEFMSAMMSCASLLNDKPKMDFALAEFRLGDVPNPFADEILYIAYEGYKKMGIEEQAEQLKKELLKKFPDSYWADHLKKKGILVK